MIGLPLRVSRKLFLRRFLVSFVVAVRKLKKGKCSFRAHLCSFWVSQSALAGSILLLENVSILCALLYHYGQTLLRLLSSNFAQAHRLARQGNEKGSRWPNMGKLRGLRGDQQNYPKAVRCSMQTANWHHAHQVGISYNFKPDLFLCVDATDPKTRSGGLRCIQASIRQPFSRSRFAAITQDSPCTTHHSLLVRSEFAV